MKQTKIPIVVSACLLGESCRYKGDSVPCPAVIALGERYTLLPVCPEVAGGLSIPRVPAERVGERVINRMGEDVTEQYQKGAEESLRTMKQSGARVAILKARSPSCGRGEIYDGSFTGKRTSRDGITAELLQAKGYTVFTEEDVEQGLLTDDLLLSCADPSSARNRKEAIRL